MEKEQFKRVQRTFNYTPTSIFTNQWSNIAFGVGMIVVPAIMPFGIRIRHLRILSPAPFRRSSSSAACCCSSSRG